MNYRALCFVDMPFGQKPDLKSGDWPLAVWILPRALLATTNSFNTQTTFDNLQVLKEARERAGQSIPELDAILTELSAWTSELRGGEEAKTK
jgi:hypothetical protein